MKKFLKWALPCFCMMFMFAACSDDDDKTEGKPGTEEPGDNPGGKDDDKPLTPDENKAKMEKIGLKAIGKIDPKDHKELLETLDEFSRLTDEGSLEVERRNDAGQIMKTIRNICAKFNLGKMLSFTAAESDLYKAAQYYGIYTYSNGRWDYKASKEKLEFYFPTTDGRQAIATIQATGKETNIDTDGTTVVSIPENVGFILTVGDKALCKLTAEISNVSNTSRTAKVISRLSVNNYIFAVEVNASRTQATADFRLYKTGTPVTVRTLATAEASYEKLITAVAKVNGNGMTNVYDDNSDEDIEDRFGAANVTIEIMEDANIKASCTDIKTLVKEADALEDRYEAEGKYGWYYDESQEYNEDYAKLLNKYLKAELRYTGSDYLVATVAFQAYKDGEYSWQGNTEEYWDIEPVMIFDDDSRFGFDEYFDDISFEDLIDSAEKLGDEYESYLKYLTE